MSAGAYARRFKIHVGVDTGKRLHVMVARGPSGRRSDPIRVDVHRQDFEASLEELRRLYPDAAPSEILVELEFAGHHGHTFAQFLREREYTTVSVLPAHTKKAKELEDNSPLKSDEKDAGLISRLVAEGIFVPFPDLEKPYRELRILVTERQRLSDEQIRFRTRPQGLLDVVWPEFMTSFGVMTHRTPFSLLERWPLPEDILAVHPETVMRHVKKTSRNHIKREKVRRLLQSAEQTVGLRSAPAERRQEIVNLFERWKLVRRQMKRLDERIAEEVERCPPARALTTIPMVSTHCAATIVSELGTPETYEHPKQILKLAGMDLVGRSSGLSVYGRRWQSKRGRPRLRKELFLLAGRWCQPRGLYRADYLAMLERNGMKRTKAVAAMARKLVPLLFAVMRSEKPFDEELFHRNRRGGEAA